MMSNRATHTRFIVGLISLLSIVFVIQPQSIRAQSPDSTATSIGQCLSPEEAELANRINSYRQQNGLAAIPVSRSLTTVAQYHVVDLHTYRPDRGTDSRGMACNMHSWSEHGIWSPLCYTSDHYYASGMWDKPAEITGNVYTAPGFEISYRHSGGATAQNAFQGWSNSEPHNDVMLNRNNWSNIVFRGIGVGIYEEYAVVWFAEQTDPQGTLTVCSPVPLTTLDVNSDGIISPEDAIYVTNHTGSSDSLADVNDDGSVTAADVQLILDALGTPVNE